MPHRSHHFKSTKLTISMVFCIIMLCLSACGSRNIIPPTAAPSGSSGSVRQQHTEIPEIIPSQEPQQPTKPPKRTATKEPQASYRSQVIINGKRISDDDLQALVAQYNLRISDGHYWYDSYSGAWGYINGPILGFIRAGLSLGGRLQADASGGETGVFLNGRELHGLDLNFFAGLVGELPPGDYWLDSQFNFGVVNGTEQVNLLAIIQQRNNNSGAAPPQDPPADGDGLNLSQGDCTIIDGDFSCSSPP